MRERINAALKQATVDGDRRRGCTLRLVNAAIKDRDTAARAAGNGAVDKEAITAILVKMIKQRLESARAFDEGGRPEIASQEREEIGIIESFLPEQLGEAEVQSVCEEAIKETGAHGLRDMGKCMQALKARYAGRMDFGKASTVVKGKLS